MIHYSIPCTKALTCKWIKKFILTYPGNLPDLISRRHIIGASIGGSIAVSLSVSSFIWREVRCTMMLIVPGLFAGRGRALLLTLATGLLIDGPVTTINENLEQVIKSLTCMYKVNFRIDRFHLDQNPPSPFSSFTKHARSLPFFSHHAVGRNDLPKRVSHSSNGIGLYGEGKSAAISKLELFLTALFWNWAR